MRVFLLPIFALLASACITERPTGYKANPDNDGYVVETCDEDEIMNNWWSFETENAIVNTLAPSSKIIVVMYKIIMFLCGIQLSNMVIIIMDGAGIVKMKTI